MTTLVLAALEDPSGPDFGKASPIGLFISVVLLLVVLFLGYCLSRRTKRMARRRAFAEEHGIDFFDTEKLDAAMKEAGLEDKTKNWWL
ncbi:MAG: hypothetical protein Q3972_02645 [Corynebacterium sp.]|nr:hypothetical protein [Corynebacterium sp.]